MNDKTVVKVDRYYPSSKTCSVCGWKNESLSLADRSWTCPECGTKNEGKFCVECGTKKPV